MYTTTLTTNASYVETMFTAKSATLREAAVLKIAWERNQPYLKGSVVVFDADGYLVPWSEIKVALRIERNQLQNELSYFEGLDLE